jgi:hypothetical protein
MNCADSAFSVVRWGNCPSNFPYEEILDYSLHSRCVWFTGFVGHGGKEKTGQIGGRRGQPVPRGFIRASAPTIRSCFSSATRPPEAFFSLAVTPRQPNNRSASHKNRLPADGGIGMLGA